jgi:hypothetical protein
MSINDLRRALGGPRFNMRQVSGKRRLWRFYSSVEALFGNYNKNGFNGFYDAGTLQKPNRGNSDKLD